MITVKYAIPEIMAVHLLEAGSCFDATDPSKKPLVTESLQDVSPMFDQARRVLGLREPMAGVCRDLYDVFVRVDFSGIFDRRPVGKALEYQKIADRLFRPEGIAMNFGGADHIYRVFEGSANMSRHSEIYFVRSDLYDVLRERTMLGMTIGTCQLSKLCAYNGLLFTSGERIREERLLYPDRIVVINNPKSVVKNAPVITVEDDGTDNPVRTYHRVEKRMDVEVLEFDGEGLVSKELAKSLGSTWGHHSFQIRMPYVKGVVHEVDYKKLFEELGVTEITDIWGGKHRVSDVDLILTKSMFKGFGWMTENGLTWAEYLERYRKYDHALYVSGRDTLQLQNTTTLNYQFLSTLAMMDEEFRPKDLSLGWEHSPAEDARDWLTKTTEIAYYDFAANRQARLNYFLQELAFPVEQPDRRRQRIELLQQNPGFLDEPFFVKEAEERAKQIAAQYAKGELLTTGDTRYLSDDLMRLLAYISGSDALEAEFLSGNTIYAPKAAYPEQESYTLLRSPHIARNEEALVKPLKTVGTIREKYLSHLHYVLMVDSRSLIPDRLGGADYDGDTVKTIADPLLNACVMRGYTDGTPPVLKIPAAKPRLSDANDWEARFETAKSTFSSRIGQISNAALRRSLVAYDENSDDEMRKQFREETEVLAILTGLEIDSAKSGVKPNLSAYLGVRDIPQSLFLQYKEISTDRKPHKWYEPTKTERKNRLFQWIDWNEETSNLEKLPYYAEQLEQQTPKYKPHPASDVELFPFAADADWKQKRDPAMMARIESLAGDYETAIQRCQRHRHRKSERSRESDIYRILYLRGQEKTVPIDQLYETFDRVHPDALRRARLALELQQWHLTSPAERERIYYEIMPRSANHLRFMDVFCDFRNSGFRLLGDVICDLDDLNRSQDGVVRDTDSADLKCILSQSQTEADYREGAAKGCIHALEPPGEKKVDLDEAVRCALALGKRRFVLAAFPGVLLQMLNEKPKKKRRGLFRRDK